MSPISIRNVLFLIQIETLLGVFVIRAEQAGINSFIVKSNKKEKQIVLKFLQILTPRISRAVQTKVFLSLVMDVSHGIRVIRL